MKFPKLKTLCCGLVTASLSLSLGTSTFASNFSDTQGHWGEAYVNTSVNAGLMSGTGNSIFAPNGTMTYGQLAVVIVNGAFNGETVAKSTDTHWSDIYLNVLSDEGVLEYADLPTSTGCKILKSLEKV